MRYGRLVRWATIMLGSAGAAAAPRAGPALGNEDLQAAVTRYQRAAGDRLTPNPTQEDIIGRDFRTVTPFLKLRNAGGARIGRIGGWTYDAGEGMLTLDLWVDRVAGFQIDPSLHGTENTFYGFVIAGHERYGVTKGNAMGATIQLDPFGGPALAVAAFDGGSLGTVFPNRSTDDRPTKLRMTPAEARDVAPHMVLIVEGEVAPYKGARAIVCSGIVPPMVTFESRIPVTLWECIVSARIERYAIEDRRTGKVLAEWRPS